jgi:hypothetical protein
MKNDPAESHETEIADESVAAANLHAKIDELRQRLAALEAGARKQRRRPTPKMLALLIAGVMLAGATIVFGQDVANALFISAGGNVGIGTNNPLSKLHVVAPGGFGNENADGTAQPGNVPMVAQSDSTAIGILNGSGRPAFALNIDNNGGANTTRGVPTFLDRYDGNWHSSLSLKNGNVGIGTSPTNRLSVAGNADISGTLNVTQALRADGNSFLYANGSTDGTNNVVLRKDAIAAYIFPWGPGTRDNTVAVGGGTRVDFLVTGDLKVNGAMTAPSVNGEKPPMVFEVGDKGRAGQWSWANKDIGPLCGDADGCTIKFFFRDVTNDEVRTISEQIYIEQPDKSNNKTPGRHGWTRQGPGEESQFILGTLNRYDIVPHPWNWIYVRNYSSGETGSDRLLSGTEVQFMTRPNISATVIIYDR